MRIYRLAFLFLCVGLSLQVQAKVLKVGVSFYDPPFVILGANNQFFGFDISLMEHVCKTMGYECQFNPMPFNELLDSIDSNKIDFAISSIIITPERAARFNFSAPYLVSKTRFLAVKQPEEKPFTLQSLANKKIGLADKVFAEQLKAMGLDDSQFVVFNRDDALIQALNDGKVAVGLIDNPSAIYWQEHSSGALEAQGKPMIYGLGLGVAVSPADQNLIPALNMAILKYQNSDDFIDDYHKYLSHLSHAEENNADSL
ncbi:MULTISPECIES: transporter substrate-binding domain-containing protein [Legionella]|uniref:Putative amino acid ABC transporter, periplasmic binding protein n=1 Tax=Legionella drozanskii LLAP-1 TaxID=1212489 RepID=A0A0W0SMP4_9GAMM|nr:MULTISPECIES: transporter substrate-binding domain-containing protein [Legionella]KTC84603.1 putative amino acid ABC transporter, periplasmic binding protein [Legionella drozanskii LLAP-1]